jgi:hypothetical protein
MTMKRTFETEAERLEFSDRCYWLVEAFRVMPGVTHAIRRVSQVADVSLAALRVYITGEFKAIGTVNHKKLERLFDKHLVDGRPPEKPTTPPPAPKPEPRAPKKRKPQTPEQRRAYYNKTKKLEYARKRQQAKRAGAAKRTELMKSQRGYHCYHVKNQSDRG